MHSWCQFYVGVLSKLYSIVKTFSKRSGNEAATSLVLFLTFVTLDVCPPTPRAILSIINVQISYISHQRESGIQAGGGVGGGGVGHRNRQTHACTHWNGKTVFWDDGDVLWWLRRRPTCPNWNFTPVSIIDQTILALQQLHRFTRPFHLKPWINWGEHTLPSTLTLLSAPSNSLFDRFVLFWFVPCVQCFFVQIWPLDFVQPVHQQHTH